MTKQRRLILSIVESSHDHLTAEEIFFKAKEKMLGIALGTVYRNLNILAEEGIVRRLAIAGRPDRFDNTEIKHEHLICKSCGRLKDVKLEGIDKLLQHTTGEEILSYDLNAYYVCERCKHREVM